MLSCVIKTIYVLVIWWCDMSLLNDVNQEKFIGILETQRNSDPSPHIHGRPCHECERREYYS